MMLRRPTGSRLAAWSATTVVAVTTVLVLPAPAHADQWERGESAYNSVSPKTATAACDPGEVVIGAGGRVKDGQGRVRLAAVVPTRTSVEVRADELSEGHAGNWSVVAAAVCAPEAYYAPTVRASLPGSSKATCANGTVPSGTGFELPGGSVLTGLIPDEEGTGVTVRTPYRVIGLGEPVAYAICLPGSPPSSDGPRYTRFDATSPVNGSSPKTATVTDPLGWAALTGVGAEITMGHDDARLIPSVGSDIFIDGLWPSSDLTRVTVQAVHRPSGDDVTVAPAHRLAGTSVAGDDDDWSVTGYGLDHDYY